MRVMYERCAGLDIHKKTVTACRRNAKEQEVKTFGTTTPDLLELVDWLLEWECTHVAMESTGDYWKPIYNLLEGSFQILLVNAKHVKHVPGRKTDIGDAQWLAELMQYGLLKASFIPPSGQRDLRDLTRYRTKQVQERAREVNRVQKLLETANIKLSSIATNVLGVSGRAMLEAIVAGEGDPEVMAQLAKGRMRSKLPELEKALTGVVREHHRFLLANQLAHIDFLDEHISGLSAEIERRIHEMSQTQAPPPSNTDSETKSKTPEKSGTPDSPSFENAVELLDTIPGVDKLTAELIVAELGIDMSRFPTPKHAAAWAASRTKNTYLSAQYSRLAGRRGKNRAIVAVAHSILVMSYHILKRQQPYKELGGDYFDERKKESILHGLVKRISKLGYEVSLEPTVA